MEILRMDDDWGYPYDFGNLQPSSNPGGMDVLVDNMLGEIAKFGPSSKGGVSEEAIQAAAKHWSSRSLASLVSDEEEASP